MNLPEYSPTRLRVAGFLALLLGLRSAPVISITMDEYLVLTEPGAILHSMARSGTPRRTVFLVECWDEECVIVRLNAPMRRYLERQTALRGFTGASADFLDLVEESYRAHFSSARS